MSQYTLYKLYKRQQRKSGSTDSWVDSIPNVLSYDGNGEEEPQIASQCSISCGFPLSNREYRWAIDHNVNNYVCVGVSKHYKETYQVSYDSGFTWSNVVPEQFRTSSSIIEEYSEDCGYQPLYRWVTVDNEYECENVAKYTKEKKQISYDSGSTWTDVEPLETRKGELIEEYSEDCGYQPLYRWAMTNDTVCLSDENYFKFKAYYSDNTFYSGACSNNTTLTSEELREHTTTYLNMTSVVVGNCVTTIGTSAFDGATSLSSVTLGENVEVIDSYAFRSCDGLTDVEIPYGIIEIGIGAFTTCSNMDSLIISETVERISSNAFKFCTNLQSITLEAVVPPSLGLNVFDNTNNCPIYVPSESVNTYKSATNWSDYADRIQAI